MATASNKNFDQKLTIGLHPGDRSTGASLQDNVVDLKVVHAPT